MHESKFGFLNIFILLSIAGVLINSAESLECHICSSNVVETCSTLNEDKELSVGPCANDVTSCFTKVSNGLTIRGCFPPNNSILQFECSNNNGHSACALCDSNTCNDKIFPSVVLQHGNGGGETTGIEGSVSLKNNDEDGTCIECDSNTDADCRDHPEIFQGINCLGTEGCYLQIEGDQVKRGCTNALEQKQKNLCKYQSNTCKTCMGGTCNRKTTFQTCYSCDTKDSPECVQNVTAIGTVVCREYLDTCVTGIDGDGQTHRRCSIHKKTNDDEFPKGYTECQRNKCNGQEYPKNRQHCFQCDDCDLTTPTLDEPHSTFCSTYKEKDECFTYVSEERKIFRGCMSDKNQNQFLCEKNGTRCVRCSGNACNNQPRSKEPEVCVKCDSEKDKLCKSDPKTYAGKKCDSIELLNEVGCYLSVDGKRVKRGCVSDLIKDVKLKHSCTSQSDTCKTCSGTNCNQRVDFQRCYSCEENSKSGCSEIDNSTDTEVCKDYLNPCITGVDRHGNSVRRCSLGKKADDYLLVDYTQCSEDMCNNDVYPKDRLRCYQCELCDSIDELAPVTCKKYLKKDQCYTHIHPEYANIIYRGCESDLVRLEPSTCNEDFKNCITCDRNGCNNQPKLTPPKLSCINCNDNGKCAFGQNPEDSVACKNDVIFLQKESCYSRSVSQSIVIRGCTLEADEEDAKSCANLDDPSCTTCTKSKCNTDNVLYSSCVQCDSSTDKDCEKVVDEKKINKFSKLCDKSVYPWEKRGCFTETKDGKSVRGCTKDLSEVALQACDKGDHCKLCVEDNCNSPTSASTKIFVNFLLIFVSISLAILY